jgi:hypothetical protein
MVNHFISWLGEEANLPGRKDIEERRTNKVASYIVRDGANFRLASWYTVYEVLWYHLRVCSLIVL